MTGLYTAFVLLWLGGYLAGRSRPANWLVDWADDQLARRPARSPRYWLAVPIALAAVAVLWAIHPRRTLANYRANQAARARRSKPAAVPRYDPEWPARRGGPSA